jgi:hypothetical protein
MEKRCPSADGFKATAVRGANPAVADVSEMETSMSFAPRFSVSTESRVELERMELRPPGEGKSRFANGPLGALHGEPSGGGILVGQPSRLPPSRRTRT